jgi:menaquinone-9 beta-reductase
MTDSKEVDVLIIGGGPAGLSAAIVCARNGLKTILVEKKRFPVDKACGEGLMPAGVQSLISLGASKYLSSKDYQPFSGVLYRLEGEPPAAGLFESGEGWGIRRTALSNALFRAAKEHQSLSFLEGEPAAPHHLDRKQITVTVGDMHITPRLLIGADGRSSRVRKWAELAGKSQYPFRWGAVQHFPVKPWSRMVEVYWGNGVEAYITPVSSGEISLAFLWDRRRISKVYAKGSLFKSFLESFPTLKNRLGGVEPTSPIMAAGPLEQKTTAVVSDQILLTGDAAGYLDAITGEGISLALSSAFAIEEYVVPLFTTKTMKKSHIKKEDLTGYEEAYKKIVKPYQQTTRLALILARNPAIQKFSIRTLRKRPQLFQHFLSSNMGLKPVFPGIVHLIRLLIFNNPNPGFSSPRSESSKKRAY